MDKYMFFPAKYKIKKFLIPLIELKSGLPNSVPSSCVTYHLCASVSLADSGWVLSAIRNLETPDPACRGVLFLSLVALKQFVLAPTFRNRRVLSESLVCCWSHGHSVTPHGHTCRRREAAMPPTFTAPQSLPSPEAIHMAWVLVLSCQSH